MMRKALLMTSASLFLSVSLGVARAEAVPPCDPPAGIVSKPLGAATPAGLLAAVKKDLGDLAAPGEAFDATDVVKTGRSRRLIFAWNQGTRWVLATEHGGRGYNNPILAYDVSADGAKATLVEKRIVFVPTYCATAKELLRLKTLI